jgi:hypothetical protein
MFRLYVFDKIGQSLVGGNKNFFNIHAATIACVTY